MFRLCDTRRGGKVIVRVQVGDQSACSLLLVFFLGLCALLAGCCGRILVRGQIVDGIGRPLPGVAVEFYDGNPGGAPSDCRLLGKVKTNSQGKYRERLPIPVAALHKRLKKEGYVECLLRTDPPLTVRRIDVQRRLVPEAEVRLLTTLRGEELDQALEEVLGAFNISDVMCLLFQIEDHVGPALRRAAENKHPAIRAAASRVLLWIGSAEDTAFVRRRMPLYTPPRAISASELRVAINAVTRELVIEEIGGRPVCHTVLNRNADKALVECHIVGAPEYPKGCLCSFSLHKINQRWVLKSFLGWR